YRVSADAENDRDRRSGGLGRKCRRIAAWRGNHGNATTGEVGHERRETIIFSLQPVIFDRRVLAFDCAGLAEALAERSNVARSDTAAAAPDKRDNRHSSLLRARCERPCRGRAAERGYQLPPSDGDWQCVPFVRSSLPSERYHGCFVQTYY